MTQFRTNPDSVARPSSSQRMTRRAFCAALPASLLAASSTPGISARTATPAATPVATPAGDATSAPTFHVTQTSVRFDERFNVWVEGLEPGQEVTITASFIDHESEWTADATFGADNQGLVDLSMHQPVQGSWDIPDSMGLVWSAQGSRFYTPLVNSHEYIRIAVRVDDEVIGAKTVVREILPQGHAPVYIYEENLVAIYYEPASGNESAVPAVIVLGGAEGGLSPYADLTAAVLSSHGYATLALAYFGIGQLPTGLSKVPLEYFGNAIAWLQGQRGVDSDRIGVVGASRGGEAALLVGSRYPEIKAVVSYVGSGYADAEWRGSTSNSSIDVSAWTWNGDPVRHLDALVMTEAELSEAEIPVERINGPVLLIGADADALWPSSRLSSVAWERLQREEHPWPDQFLRYPGAGHGISMPPYMPVNWLVTPELGGDPRSNAVAMANAWPAVVQMLNTRLMYG